MAKGKKKENAIKRKREDSESKKIEISKPKKPCNTDLGNLSVQGQDIGNVLPTRQSVFEQLKVSVQHKHFSIVEGPIGSGKTFIAKYVGRELNLPLKVMQLGDQIDSKSLFGSYQSTEVAGQFRYQCSKFTLWLKEPCLIILEDIDMANADVISKVVELAASRKAVLPSGDEVLFDDSVRIIATSSARGKRSNVLEGVPSRVLLSPLTEKELRRLIIDTYPRCAHLAKTLVSVFLAVQTVPFHANSRILTSVDLLRACARLSSNYVDLSSNMEIFVELVDCWCLSDPSERSRLLCEKVASCLTITSDQLSFHLTARQPTFSHDDYKCKIGRSVLPRLPSLKISQSHRLGHTRDVLQLMERIAVCVRQSEPTLLVGETGVGKTSVVQSLASALHLTLKVVNVSPTSDSDELIEGYKPTTVAHILEPFTKFYHDVFTSCFDAKRNEKFLTHLETCLSAGRYRDYLVVVENTAQKALMSKDQNDPRWAEVVVRARRIRQGLEKNAVPFTVMRGAVLEAIQEGTWLLIDEINLASPECLDAIVHAISANSHPNFRLFACMNPATDAGKRRLPPSVRTKFTEFYVDEMTDPIQLGLVVSSYLPSLKHSVVETLVTFYLKSRENYPGCYSLRTLCRALLFAADNLFGSEERSLYEAVCMAFLTNLSVDDKIRMKTAISNTFKVQTNVPIPQPSNKDDLIYLNVMGYWVEQGQLLPKVDKNYVLTKTVKANMAEISRIVCSGRFPILLEGETSAGKTSIVSYLAKITGNSVVRINNHEHTDVQEYMGSYVADESGRLVFREGALVKAVRDGSWVILDELNLAPTDVIEALNRLLDDNRELFIPELNTTVQAHRRFRLFATQNPAGTYAGRKRLSRALLSRFVVMRFNHLPMDELSAMVCTRCEIHASAATKMIAVLTELRTQRSLSGLFSARDGLMTLRDVFRWAKRLSTDETTDDWLQILANHGYFLLAGRCRNKKDEQTVVSTLERVLKRTIDTNMLFDKNSGYFPKHLNFEKIVLTIGMRRMLVMTYQAWLRDEAVLMVGETGGGKTSLAQTLGGDGLLSINCHERTETADFLGRLRPKSNGGFEWSDGVVIVAMRKGLPLLIDEISLAEDSVLERLNPLFEEDRTLLLSDAGVDVQTVSSSAGFQMIATMNPGGDYGKKELSKALRNRFTEVWSSNDYEKSELVSIFDTRLSNTLQEEVPSVAATTIVNWIAEFFGKYAHIFRHSASVRDVVACADIYVSCVKRSIPTVFSIREALSAVFLDAIASQPTRIAMDVAAILEDADRILFRVIEKSEDSIENVAKRVICCDGHVQIGPLTIEHGPLPVRLPRQFSLNAPTCVSNFYRIARGLLIDKPILLEGSPGCGKSSTVMALAELTGHPITRLNLSDQTDLTDLFGSDIPVVTDDGTISFRWEDGPVLRAIKKGEWILLDEMNLASQSVLEGLNACFDHRKILFIAELNKSFEIPSGNGCRFFACQNPRAQGGNRRALPKSFVNRFTNIWVDDLTVEDIVFILSEIDTEKVLTEKQINAMVQINKKLSDDTTLVGGPYSFNLRDLLRWLHYYSTKGNMVTGYELLYVSRMRQDIDRTKLRELYEELLEEPYTLSPVFISMDSKSIRIGEAHLPRLTNIESDCMLLPSQMTLLSDLASCVEHNWLTLLIGPKNSGKFSTVKTLADVCGVELVKISLNSETDAQELIGSYEQVVDTNALNVVKKNISANLRNILDDQLLISIDNSEDLLSLEIAVENVLKHASGHPGIVQECKDLMEIAARSDMRFAWIDSVFVKAFLEGHWIVIEDVNLCSAAVLDRLNSCLETGGKLVISERQSSFEALEAHSNFRVFLSMDPKNGEISRAMRNRSVELYMKNYQMWFSSPEDIVSLCPSASLTPFSMEGSSHYSQSFPYEFSTVLAEQTPETLLHFFVLLSEYSFENAARALGIQNQPDNSIKQFFHSIPVKSLNTPEFAEWFAESWARTSGPLLDKFLHCFLSCSPAVMFSQNVIESFGDMIQPFLINAKKQFKSQSSVYHSIDERYHGFNKNLAESEELKTYILNILCEWTSLNLKQIAVKDQSAEHQSRTLSKYEMSTNATSFKNLPLIAGFIDVIMRSLSERSIQGSSDKVFQFCISLFLFVHSARKNIETRSGISPIYIAWNELLKCFAFINANGTDKLIELMEKGWSSKEHARFLSEFLKLYDNYKFTEPFSSEEDYKRFTNTLMNLRNNDSEDVMEEDDKDDEKQKKTSLLSEALSFIGRMHSVLRFLCTSVIDEKDSIFSLQKVYSDMPWHSESAERSVRNLEMINSAFSDDQRVLNIPQVGCFPLLYTRLWSTLGYDITLSNLSVDDLQKFSIATLISQLWRLGPNSDLLSRRIKEEIYNLGKEQLGWYAHTEESVNPWANHLKAARSLIEKSLPPVSSLDPVVFGEERSAYLAHRLEMIDRQLKIVGEQFKSISRLEFDTLPNHHPVLKVLNEERLSIVNEIETTSERGQMAYRPEADNYFALSSHMRVFYPVCNQIFTELEKINSSEHFASLDEKSITMLTSTLISFTMSADNFKKITMQKYSAYTDIFMPFFHGLDLLLYGVFEVLSSAESYVRRKDLLTTAVFPHYFKVRCSQFGIESSELLSWAVRDSSPMPLSLKAAVARKRLSKQEECNVNLLWAKKQWQKWYEKNIAKAAEKDFIYRNKTEEEKDELDVAEFFSNLEQDKEIIHHNDLMLLVGLGIEDFNDQILSETSEMKYKLALTWIQEILMNIGTYNNTVHNASITSDLLTLKWILAQESTSEKEDVDVYRSVSIKELRRATALLDALVIRTEIVRDRWPEVVTLKQIIDKVSDFSLSSLATSQIKMATLVENIIEQCEEWEKIADRANSLEEALAPLRELLVDWKKMEVRHWSQLLVRYENDCRMKAFLASYPLFNALFQADTPEALNNVVPMSVDWIHNSTILDFETRVKNVQILSEWASRLGHNSVHFKLNSIAAHFSIYIPKIKAQLKDLRDPADQTLQDYVKIVKYNDLNLWSIKVASTKAHAHLFKIIRRFKESVVLEASSHFDKLIDLQTDSQRPIDDTYTVSADSDKLVLRANTLAKKITETGAQLSDLTTFTDFSESVTSCDENLRAMINYDQYEEDEQKEKAQGYARNCRQREVALVIKDAQSLGLNARKAVTLNSEAVSQKSISGLFTKGDLENFVRVCAAGRNACIRIANKPNDQLGVATRKHLNGVIEYGMNWMCSFYNTMETWSTNMKNFHVNVIGLNRANENLKSKWIIDHEMTLHSIENLKKVIEDAHLIINNWKEWLDMTPDDENELKEDYMHPLSLLQKGDSSFEELKKRVSHATDLVNSLYHIVECMVKDQDKIIFAEKTFISWIETFKLNRIELITCLEPLQGYFDSDITKVKDLLQQSEKIMNISQIEVVNIETNYEPALLFIQSMHKNIVDVEKAADIKVMEKFDIIYNAIANSNVEKLLEWSVELLTNISGGQYPDKLNSVYDVANLCSTMMESFQIVMHNILYEFTKAYYSIVSMAMQLLEKGYVNTIPKDDKQKSGEGETDEAGEGGGMGEGKSSSDAKDVTDEMEETGQIEGLQDDEEEPPCGEEGTNEKPIDMEEDFAEDLQDIDKNEKGNDNDEEDNEDEEAEPEDQMGDVEEADDNQLDPKLWDDEKEQDNNQLDQDNAGADNENNELAAKEDDPMAGNEEEQDTANDENEQKDDEQDDDNVDDQENVDERDRENEGNEETEMPQEDKQNMNDDFQEDLDLDNNNEDAADEADETENAEHMDIDDEEDEEQKDSLDDDAPKASDDEEEAERNDHVEAMQQGDGGEKQEEDKELEGNGANEEEEEENKNEDKGDGKSSDDTKGKDGAGAEELEEKKEDEEKEGDEEEEKEGGEKEKQLATEDMEAEDAPEGEGEEHEKGQQVEGTPSGTKESLGAGSIEEARESKKNENLKEKPKMKKTPTAGAEETMDIPDETAVEESQSSIHLAATDLYQLAEGLNKDLILEEVEKPEESTLEKNDTTLETAKPFAEAEKMWNEISRSVSLLSAELAENLRLILEPQRANKMQGDYRTGKRLNMRRLIPYIASDYRKDRIWMRRTKRAQREYQVMIAVDDSASMNENGIHQVTCESVCAIDDALRRCDAGAVSVISFGSDIKTICSFGDSMIAGPEFIQKLTFDQSSTDLIGLLNHSRRKLNEVRTPTSEQLLIIVSDGRGALAQGADKVKKLVGSLQGVTVLFVVLDSGAKSITELSVASFQSGSVVLTPYLQLFPFPFYVIIKSIQQLPSVLSESIRQWFEMTVNSFS